MKIHSATAPKQQRAIRHTTGTWAGVHLPISTRGLLPLTSVSTMPRMVARQNDKKAQPTLKIVDQYGAATSGDLLFAHALVSGKSCDDNSIIWPAPTAPFVNTKLGASDDCNWASNSIHTERQTSGGDVLRDDTDGGAGGKFTGADLIGLPRQVIIGPRGLGANHVEVKSRKNGERRALPFENAVSIQGAAA